MEYISKEEKAQIREQRLYYLIDTCAAIIITAAALALIVGSLVLWIA